MACVLHQPVAILMGEVFTSSDFGAATTGVEDSSIQLVLEYYDREHAALIRYLCFLSVDPETAKEIVQDCFIKLHEHLKSNGDTSNLRAWLYRVAHNLARNSQESIQYRRTESLEAAVRREPAARERSAEEGLLKAERAARLRTAMLQLPDAHRQALVLRSQGLKYREIAVILGLSTSTVAENIQRSMGTLKTLLEANS